jgi:cob(I)alamin adenosyltransferase
MSLYKNNPMETDLVGRKTTKLDSRVIFFGTCDELSCHIMEIRCMIEEEEIKNNLVQIVKELSIIMGDVAGGKTKLQEQALINLINVNRLYEENNGIITEFVLPGQNLLSSRIHITRCVARRCELAYAKVYDEHEGSKLIFQYLNKLSTLFYNLALRYEK